MMTGLDGLLVARLIKSPMVGQFGRSMSDRPLDSTRPH
jgi:hypothetical protein